MSSGNSIFDWFVSVLDSWSQHSSLRNTIKLILHQLTGKCELERICQSGSANWLATRKVENSLYHSKFPELRRILVAEEIRLKDAMQNVLRIKHIVPDDNSVFITTMPKLIAKIVSYNALKSTLDATREESYDEENQEHENMLSKLWNFLQPDVKLEERYTKQWTRIGFQGNNPATDFRGMGILSLRCLLFFLENHPDEARKIYGQSLHPQYGFPFAVAGINFTGVTFELLRSGKLKSHFYNLMDDKYTIEHFYDVFIRLFCDFCNFYISEEPENIMAFNVLKNKYTEMISVRLDRGEPLERTIV